MTNFKLQKQEFTEIQNIKTSFRHVFSRNPGKQARHNSEKPGFPIRTFGNDDFLQGRQRIGTLFEICFLRLGIYLKFDA
jgi:DNA phosphorothioation-dependent restriction protein DptG